MTGVGAMVRSIVRVESSNVLVPWRDGNVRYSNVRYRCCIAL